MRQKYMKYTLLLLLLFSVVSAHAHLNRSEKPKSMIFIFQNKDTLRLNNADDSLRKAYNHYIIQQRKKLREVRLTFEAGETLTVTADKHKWTAIKITDGKHEVSIPDSTLRKLTEIHFATLSLVWSGSESRPFGNGYFYIRFDMGTKKTFNRYSWLNLIIADYRYSKALIWHPTGVAAGDKASANF